MKKTRTLLAIAACGVLGALLSPASAAAQSPGASPSPACRGNSLVIDGDAALEAFDELECVEFVGDLTIRGTGVQSAELSELGGLEKVDGTLSISGMQNLETLAGLSGLREVSGDLVILGNERLERLAGLETLTKVGGTLTVAYHPRLAGIGALGKLEEVGGSVKLVGNARLASLDGLERLRRVGDTLHLAYLPGVQTLAPLSGLTSTRSLVIEGNSTLTRLELPAKLAVIEADLKVADNPRLDTIVASQALSQIGSTVEFGHNGSLDRCEVDRLLKRAGRATSEEAVNLKNVGEECAQ